MTVTVSNTSGPFQVTSPNTNVSWAGGSTQTIMWDVAGTTGAPVSCAAVKISLSTDGGTTFPTVLSASTPNDGSEALTIPNVTTTTARVKVEAVGNIFFDISDSNFTITGGSTPTPTPTAQLQPQRPLRPQLQRPQPRQFLQLRQDPLQPRDSMPHQDPGRPHCLVRNGKHPPRKI